jgi:hypothetical protein
MQIGYRFRVDSAFPPGSEKLHPYAGSRIRANGLSMNLRPGKELAHTWRPQVPPLKVDRRTR